MLLKSIDGENGRQVSTRVWVKAGLLAFTLLLGMGFVTFQAKQSNTTTAKKVTNTNIPASGKDYSIIPGKKVPSKTPSPTKGLDLNKVAKEGQKLLGISAKETEKIANNVLGEVSERVQATASNSAHAVTDYVYENTVGEVIKTMLNSLPEREREEVKQNICKP